MKHLKVIVSVLIVLALNGVPAVMLAQTAAQQPGSKAGTKTPGGNQPQLAPVIESIEALPEGYELGPGDSIDIAVDDAPELSRSYRIDKNGEFTMKFVGRVKASGKTPDGLAAMIAESLRGDYLSDPNVTISVKRLNMHLFYVQGAVNRAGAFPIDGKPDLLKLLSLAGGLSENHGTTAYVIRQVKADESTAKKAEPSDENKADASQPPHLIDAPMYTFFTVNINGMFKGLGSQNMFLEPNDIVNIPVSDLFFVSGDVRAPGSFTLRDGTTVRQALAMAQGMKATARTSKGLIFRENPENGDRIQIKIDLGKVMAGKEPDQVIRPNDILIVPLNVEKAITYQFLNAAAFGIAMGLISRAIYY
jgi:polysaccharide biosynthesis/export protein